MGKLVEGLWDCPYCDTTSIKASQKTCPNCGHPQDENTVFRMPDTISYVSDEDAVKISQNPDWQCSFCGSLNKDIDNSCNNCGASKEESEKNYFEMRRERDEKSNKKQNMAVKAIDKSSDNCISKSKGDNVILESLLTSIAIIAITASIILGIWVISCLAPTVKNVTIDDFDWERTINIEEIAPNEQNMTLQSERLDSSQWRAAAIHAAGNQNIQTGSRSLQDSAGNQNKAGSRPL